MSVNKAYPRELEQRYLTRYQYCRGCIVFLKHADQQDPLLMQQAGVDSDVYGHPVLILATHVAKNGLKCVRAAVITSRGGYSPPSKWAHTFLPIWPKAVTCVDAPQLFLGEGRTLPKESYVCLRNTWDFGYSMLSQLGEPAESYYFHLTRESFNIVAGRLEYPPMKLLDDLIPRETMTVPPARVGINPGQSAGTRSQSNAQEEKQWLQEYLQRRLKNPGRVAQYLAAWEKENIAGSGRASELFPFIDPGRRQQPTFAFPRPGEDRSSTFVGARQPAPLSPIAQVNISSSPQSLTPASVHGLMKRLQTICPPQLTKETHHTTKAQEPRSKNEFATRPRLENAHRPSQEPTAAPTLSFYDFSVLSLVLLVRALWFFLNVFLVLTYKTMAWFLSVLARKTPRAIRGWMKKTAAAIKQRLQIVAAEVKKTVKEVLEQ